LTRQERTGNGKGNKIWQQEKDPETLTKAEVLAAVRDRAQKTLVVPERDRQKAVEVRVSEKANP
jgi:hypothetical protein